RWLGSVGRRVIKLEVGKVTTLINRAMGEIRVEKRTKGCEGSCRQERHSKNGLRIGLREQLAGCFILPVGGQARKRAQPKRENQTRCKVSHGAYDYRTGSSQLHALSSGIFILGSWQPAACTPGKPRML